jgi:uncharacterized protein (DUF58 family)
VAVAAAELGALLDALRGVRWPARAAAPAGSAGTHRSRLRGLSAEFTEYRPYRQGDDPRRLDWKLLARTDRAYLRITSERALLGTIVVVDPSASMAFPAPGHDKWRTAALVALGLAGVAHAAGDPVGLIVPTERGVHRAPLRTRRGTLPELARILASVVPEGTAPLAPHLAELRAGRVALVSDFLGDRDAVVRALRSLVAAGCDVHAVHVVARAELEPAGTFLAVDPESRTVRRPFDAAARAAYRASFDDWRRETARDLRAAGASVTEVTTDEAPAHAVRRVAGAAGTPARAAT